MSRADVFMRRLFFTPNGFGLGVLLNVFLRVGSFLVLGLVRGFVLLLLWLLLLGLDFGELSLQGLACRFGFLRGTHRVRGALNHIQPVPARFWPSQWILNGLQWIVR